MKKKGITEIEMLRQGTSTFPSRSYICASQIFH